MLPVISIFINAVFTPIRRLAARCLRDRGVAGETLHNVIISDMDKVKNDLHGEARIPLNHSINYFEEGYTILIICLDPDSREQRKESCKDLPDDPFYLANSVLNSNDSERICLFNEAMEKFNQCNTQASTVWSNEGLEIQKRVLAMELRIASGMLLSLSKRSIKGTITDCMTFLERLHGEKKIQKDFTVHLDGGLESMFFPMKRQELIQSVSDMNFFVYDFRRVHDEAQLSVMGWPTIKVRETEHCNPLFISEEFLEKFSGESNLHPLLSVVNSDGETIGPESSSTRNIYVVKNSSEQIRPSLLTTLPTQDGQSFTITSMAVNHRNDLFVLIRRGPNGGLYEYMLYRFETNDNRAREMPSALNFLSGETSPQLAVGNPERFVITTTRKIYIYTCSDDNPDGKVILTCDFDILHLCISGTNQIIVSTRSPSPSSSAKVHIYTMTGQKVIEPFTLLDRHSILSLAFNFNTEEILVRTCFRGGKPYLLIYSMSGEIKTILDTTSNVPHSRIISHPEGAVVLLQDTNVLRLQ